MKFLIVATAIGYAILVIFSGVLDARQADGRPDRREIDIHGPQSSDALAP